MKRHLSILACLLVVLAMVFSMASCDLFGTPDDTTGDNTGDVTPGGDNTGDETPGGDNTGDETPGDDNTGDETPGDEGDGPEGPTTAGTAEDPHVITIPGTAKVTVSEFGVVYYTFTITENKTLKVTFDTANAAVACATSTEGLANNLYNVGDVKTLETDLVAGTYYVAFATANGAAEEYNVSAEFVAKVSPYEAVIKAGENNTVTFSAADIEAGTAQRKLSVATASTYQFNGDLLIASIVDADGNAVEKNGYVYELAIGEYTIIFTMFYNEADVPYSLEVEDKNAVEDDEDDPIVGPSAGPLDTDNSELVIGDNTITVTAADIEAGAIQYTIVVTAAGTFTAESNDLGARFFDSDNIPVGYGMVALQPGTYTVAVICAGLENAGDYTLTLTYTAPATEGDEDEQIGTEEDPEAITLPAENVAVCNDSIKMNYYSVTLTEYGILTITYSNENSWVYVKSEGDTKSGQQTQTMTFTLNAGTYTICLGTWEADSGVTASISFEATEAPIFADKGNFYVGEETSFEVTDADITAGGFTATLNSVEAGEYNILANDLMISSVATEDGTVISRNDNDYFELEAYTAYIVTFSTEYVTNAGSYSATVEYQYPEGHENNPIWIYGLGDSVTATYKGDYQAVWYTFYASANGVVTITTADEAATIMLKPVGGMDVTNYDEEGNWLGSVSLTVMQGRQYMIGAIDANWSTESREIIFTPVLTEGDYVGDGSMNNPYIAGESNTATVPAWENVYFVYTAAEKGVLTLTTESTNCSWAASTEFGNFEFATGTSLSIDLEMDQKLYIAVSTANYEADSIVFTTSFKADPKEVYYEGTIATDGTANEITVETNTWVSFGFNGGGQYTVSWDNADAKVEVVAWGAPNTVLANGDVITGSMWGTNLIVYFPEYAAGTVNVTITPYVAPAQNLVVGDNTVSVTDTQFGNTVYLPISDVDVTYIVTPGTNAVVIYDYSPVLAGETVEIAVSASESVSFEVCTEDYTASDVTVNVAVKAAE